VIILFLETLNDNSIFSRLFRKDIKSKVCLKNPKRAEVNKD